MCPFYLIKMLWGRAQLFLTDPRNFIYIVPCLHIWKTIFTLSGREREREREREGRASCPLINIFNKLDSKGVGVPSIFLST